MIDQGWESFVKIRLSQNLVMENWDHTGLKGPARYGVDASVAVTL